MQCCLNMRHMHATLFSKNFLSLYITFFQLTLIIKGDVWQPGLGSRSGFFLAPWSRSRSSLKKTRSRSQSRLEKKSGAGAGAAAKLAGSSALREDKKHKEIVL